MRNDASTDKALVEPAADADAAAAFADEHGLPIAIKDLVATKGMRTTSGSLIYKDHVPAEDHILAERLKAAGAIVIGKTNTPEFGAGSHTFNTIFGATKNPYDVTRSCGGCCRAAGSRPRG